MNMSSQLVIFSSLLMLVTSMQAHGESQTDQLPQATLRTGDRVIFLGDSITQAGDRPGGYVTLVRQSIAKAVPKQGVEVLGAGISGHKVPDLQKRLQRDVLDKDPTLVVIYIGINDVWHSLQGRGTPKEQYESGLKDLIQRIRQSNSRVLLCTPSVIGEKPDGTNQLDELLSKYASISRRIAEETKTPLLDLRERFLSHLKQHNPDNRQRGVLTTDGVHLNPAGNQFVAQCMLEAFGVTQSAQKKLLRHVVLFQFKEDVTEEQIQEVTDAFAKLPEKIDVIVDFEWGTDVSSENLAADFTHCFLVTFKDTAGRDAYLPHPAHQKFVELVKPRVQKVLVVDYFAR